jgi:glycine/D-amino acid oxidase-like deaminating enzyme
MAMKDYPKYSFWMETANEDLAPRSALTNSCEVDVAILGGGYSGLWTAYYLLRANRDLRIAILEREIVGFGASGRNGGWCSSRFPVTPNMLEKRYGASAARELLLAMYATVDEVGRVCGEEGIDASFRKGGILSLARGTHQLPLIQSSFAAYQRLGLAEHCQLLNAEQTSERIRVTNAHGSLFSAESASVHPGRLIRGLAKTVERHGGRIFEQTPVTDFRPGSLITPGGEVRARRAILLAGEAYLSRLSKLHRAILPMYSLITVTEPLTADQWAKIGWQNYESIASNRYTVDYLTRTVDGRILFGSRGAPYVFGSHITDSQDRHEPTHSMLHRLVVDWFPALSGIRCTHDWGGPVGMPRDWMPSVMFDAGSKIAKIYGYTGQGVATSNLFGRLMAGLITGLKSGLEDLPVAQRQSRNWEWEPLRWLVIRYMQTALRRIDENLESGKSRPWDSRLAEYLMKH